MKVLTWGRWVREDSSCFGDVTNIICQALGTESRFHLHQRLVERECLMLSSTHMLMAAVILVLMACPGTLSHTRVISFEGVPAVQPGQQH